MAAMKVALASWRVVITLILELVRKDSKKSRFSSPATKGGVSGACGSCARKPLTWHAEDVLDALMFERLYKKAASLLGCGTSVSSVQVQRVDVVPGAGRWAVALVMRNHGFCTKRRT